MNFYLSSLCFDFGSKRTISASGGSGSLQMVSEPVTEQCASLLAVP